MPYVHIRITPEGVTRERKERLIKGVTDLLVAELDKDPRATFVVIEEVATENWGIAGQSVAARREARVQP
jgi:4-oxalocrotonate tautomerase